MLFGFLFLHLNLHLVRIHVGLVPKTLVSEPVFTVLEVAQAVEGHRHAALVAGEASCDEQELAEGVG